MSNDYCFQLDCQVLPQCVYVYTKDIKPTEEICEIMIKMKNYYITDNHEQDVQIANYNSRYKTNKHRDMDEYILTYE